LALKIEDLFVSDEANLSHGGKPQTATRCPSWRSDGRLAIGRRLATGPTGPHGHRRGARRNDIGVVQGRMDIVAAREETNML
jgi:hypothetical protein